MYIKFEWTITWQKKMTYFWKPITMPLNNRTMR
jgi:hypothetical protein